MARTWHGVAEHSRYEQWLSEKPTVSSHVQRTGSDDVDADRRRDLIAKSVYRPHTSVPLHCNIWQPEGKLVLNPLWSFQPMYLLKERCDVVELWRWKTRYSWTAEFVADWSHLSWYDGYQLKWRCRNPDIGQCWWTLPVHRSLDLIRPTINVDIITACLHTQLSTGVFLTAAARAWNALPCHITSASSLPVFRHDS